MASYVYISSPETDPGVGAPLNDPLFGPVPTLGACVPNLRRSIKEGDWLFVISGRSRKSNLPQYLIGGLRVAEKISALAAYERFPDFRMRLDDNGHLTGNIPVDAYGNKHALDTHPIEGFHRRVENYLVGDASVVLESEREIEVGRDGTLRFLSDLRNKPANRVIDVIGRASKLESGEVRRVLEWFDEVKQVSNGQRRR